MPVEDVFKKSHERSTWEGPQTGGPVSTAHMATNPGSTSGLSSQARRIAKVCEMYEAVPVHSSLRSSAKKGLEAEFIVLG